MGISEGLVKWVFSLFLKIVTDSASGLRLEVYSPPQRDSMTFLKTFENYSENVPCYLGTYFIMR